MKARLHSIFTSVGNLIHSIRFRLTIWTVIILALVLASFSTVVYTRQLNDVRNQAVNSLQTNYQALSYLYLPGVYPSLINGNVPPAVSAQNVSILLNNYQFIALLSPSGQMLQQVGVTASSNLDQLVSFINQKNSTILGIPFSFRLAGVGQGNPPMQKDFVVMVKAIQPERGGSLLGFFVMGEQIDPSGQLARLLLTLLLASASILLAAIIGGYWLVGRALHPIKSITHTAREIGETDLSQRLNLGTHDELGELANTFDQMLARLEAAFARQRQFTADASHELRTPLTIIDLESDRALSKRRNPEDYERALRTIKSENEFMTRLVNDLLTLARMDAGQTMMKMENLDLSDVVLDAVERLAPLAQQKKVELKTGDLPELKIVGDRQYLSQMVLNLVENAIKYSIRDVKQVTVETGNNLKMD